MFTFTTGILLSVSTPTLKMYVRADVLLIAQPPPVLSFVVVGGEQFFHQAKSHFAGSETEREPRTKWSEERNRATLILDMGRVREINLLIY